MLYDPLAVNTGQLILDYAAMTEKFGYLDFQDFVELWLAAHLLAEQTPEGDREKVLTYLTEVAPLLIPAA